MKRALTIACAVVLSAAAAPRGAPAPPVPSAVPDRPWVHPKALTHVYYSFEVETEGLRRDDWWPPPRDIDVTFRNLRTGRLVTIEGVGPDWGRKYWRPRYGLGRLEARVHGGGKLWCVVEVSQKDASGWAVSDRARSGKCRIKRRFGTPGPW